MNDKVRQAMRMYDELDKLTKEKEVLDKKLQKLIIRMNIEEKNELLLQMK